MCHILTRGFKCVIIEIIKNYWIVKIKNKDNIFWLQRKLTNTLCDTYFSMHSASEEAAAFLEWYIQCILSKTVMWRHIPYCFVLEM